MNKPGTAKGAAQRRVGQAKRVRPGAAPGEAEASGPDRKPYLLRTLSGASAGDAGARADAVVLDPRQVPQVAHYIEARWGFPTDAALAEAMGVHRSQISRWKAGEAAESENAWLLRDLATAVARLADHYERSTIHAWLYGENPELEGRRPLELLREGRLPEILMVIQAETSGAFL
jgi:transcriptional regulator with XRE-family HTH domain